MSGTITFATAYGVPGDGRAAARDRVVALARRFAAERDQTRYRVPFAGTAYAGSSNGALVNRGIVLALGARFTNAPALRDAAIDYVLGRNPLDQSYVSGVRVEADDEAASPVLGASTRRALSRRAERRRE